MPMKMPSLVSSHRSSHGPSSGAARAADRRFARRTAVGLAAATLTGGVLGGVPSSMPLAAQSPVRVNVVHRSTSCDDLRGTPAELTRVPEGLAVVRLQRDLATLAAMGEQRSRGDAEARALADALRRSRESLARTSRALEQALVAMDRRRSAAEDREALESALLEARRDAVVQIREVQPTIRAALERAEFEARTSRTSRGWLGVNISSVAVREELGEMLRYCEYPVVESVDPGSPAERAGLAAGDSLRAFNGRDLLAQPIDMGALLRVGSTVRVRVRRDGRTRELPVVVGERPTRVVFGRRDLQLDGITVRGAVRPSLRTDSVIVAGLRPPRTGSVGRAPEAPTAPLAVYRLEERRADDGEARSIIALLQGDSLRIIDSLHPLTTGAFELRLFSGDSVPRFSFRGIDSTRAEGGSWVTRGPDAPGRARTIEGWRAAIAPPSPVPGLVRATVGDDDGVVAGAQLTTVSSELRESFAMPEGVLVLRVLPGTPAQDAGLRGGDVLVGAGDRALRRVRDLFEAFEAAARSRRLELRVVRRDEAERRVVMRW